MKSSALCFVLGLAVAGWYSCGSGTGAGTGDWLAESEAVIRPLGWLGGRAHPATRTVELSDPDDSSKRLVTGGLVITEVIDGGPLAEVGVQRGDLLVRVGGEWLPNKEDPSRDLIRLVEAQVSAGTGAFEVGFLRGPAWKTVEVRHEKTPLQLGLPNASERLAELAQAGRERLAELQGEDGSFSVPPGMETDVATCALAGLAWLAGGAEFGDETHLGPASCRERVVAAVSDDSSPLGVWELSLAALFLAELAGPLEIELPAFSDAPGGPIHGLGTSGGAERIDLGDLPEGAQVVTFSSEDGELPEGIAEMISGMDLGEEGGAASFKVIGFSTEEPSADPMSGGGELPMEAVEGPLWTLEELVGLGGDERLPERLVDLEQAVTRLVALQQDSGGWDADDPPPGYSEATLATNTALLAIGVAGRAGVPVGGEVLTRGLAFLRERTNDGHVFAVDDPGFDRRAEAGRACGAAAALRVLNCSPTDEFLRELLEYGGEHGATIPDGRAAVPLHVLNRALIAFQAGLDARAVFFEELGPFLVSLADPGGGFALHASDAGGSLEVDRLFADPAARTALFTLAVSLQADHLPLLLARGENPRQFLINSAGEVRAGSTMFLQGGELQLDEEAKRKLLDGAMIEFQKAIRDAQDAQGEDADR